MLLEYHDLEKNTWFILEFSPKQVNRPLSNDYPSHKTWEQTFTSMFFKQSGIIMFTYSFVLSDLQICSA